MEFLKDVNRSDSIYGYNSLKFDIPFLSFRSAIHGAISAHNYRNFYDRNWIDLISVSGRRIHFNGQMASIVQSKTPFSNPRNAHPKLV